jgi:formate dehydrogenase (NADP+) alpha subunit
MIRTTCIYCGCGCQANLIKDEVEDRVIGVEPVPHHPVSLGKLCIKGWKMHEFIHHPDRLKRPLMRASIDDPFEEVSWDEALTHAADRLMGIHRDHGPGALGFLSSAKCTNEENYAMQKLARAVFHTNNIDHCARLCHASTVTGLVRSFGSGAMTNSINEIEDSDCILITGSNTTEQHPIIGGKVFDAKQKGAKLIVVDCRTIQLANWADHHLIQRPGTDVAWLNSFMHVIIDEGLQDSEFIESKTTGYQSMRDVIMQERYSPEETEAITGIPAEDLRAAARDFARAGSASVIYSMGITQHTTGVDNVCSIANLQLLTGNIGRPCTGVNPLRGQNNVQGACDLGALANVYPGYQSVEDGSVRERFAQAWGIDHEQMDPEVGLTVVEMMNAAHDGTLKGFYIMGENPMMSDPNIDHVRVGLKKLDFLLVQDIFMTPTAELAHVVLPAASFAEKDGSFTNTERRVQLIQPAIVPLGNSRIDYRIIGEIAHRCGYDGLTYNSAEEIAEEISRLTPIYGGIIHSRLKTGWGLSWPCPDRNHPGTDYLYDGGMFQKKPQGRAVFHPINFQEPAEVPDTEYPLVLTTGRILFHFHTRTMTGRSPTLEREYPHPFVEIHPSDFSEVSGIPEENIKLDQFHHLEVSATTRRGSIILRAYITKSIKRGTVFIPFHFVEAPANRLTNDVLDPVAKIPEYKACAVRIELKEGTSP